MAKEEKKEEKKEAAGAAEGGDSKAKGKAEVTPEEAAKKAKKKRLIMMAAIGVVVIGGAGFGAMKFLGKGSATTASEGHGDDAKNDEPGKHAAGGKAEPGKTGEAGKGEHAGGEAKKDESGKAAEGSAATPTGGPSDGIGATVKFEPFHLNLGNPLENRYVRMELSAEYMGGDEQLEELKRRMPQLRDAIISVTSRKSREFLLGPDGKDQLRLEILNKVNQYMTKKIENVYITDMLIE